jgi:cation diffusion facilitator family transporter
MNQETPPQNHLWRHFHSFGQEKKRPGESRTILVIVVTGAMMVVEVAAGVLFGSMALLADGLHMASHAAALTVNVLAYVYARRHARDPRYSFGTGKVNALGGFTGAVLLLIFALIMAWESGGRFLRPVAIAFDQAIWVAVAGLIVNGVSVWILDLGKSRFPEHENGRDPPEAHEHNHELGADHNLRSAYLHVLADALTSLLAIFALLAAKFFGMAWMDPLMGVVGAALVWRWSFQLLRTTSAILLDRQGPEGVCRQIRSGIEREKGNWVADLHLWSIGPHIYAAEVLIVAENPKEPAHYKELIPADLGIRHVTVEVQKGSEENQTEPRR